MTAPATAGRPRAPADRHRQVLARLALAEADRLRLLVFADDVEHRAWKAACELLHRDRELAAATIVALAAMVPDHVPLAGLVTRIDDRNTEEV